MLYLMQKPGGNPRLKIWQFQFDFVFFLGGTPHFFSLSTEREIYFELWEENILVVCWCWNRREFWSTENGTRRTNEWPRTWPCDHVTMTVWPWPWQVDVTPWTGMWPVTNALLLSKTMILHRYNVKYRTVTSTNQEQDQFTFQTQIIKLLALLNRFPTVTQTVGRAAA